MGDRGHHEITESIHEIQDHEAAHFMTETGYIPCAYSKHYISVGVFHDKQCMKPVNHIAAGNVIIEATDDGYQWGDVIHGEIKLTDPHYKRPNMSGYFASVRATVSGLTPYKDIHGQFFFRLRVHSYL